MICNGCKSTAPHDAPLTLVAVDSLDSRGSRGASIIYSNHV